MAVNARENVQSKGATSLMKKAHRNAHRFIWIILFPVILIGIIEALQARQDVPKNETLAVIHNGES